MVATGNDVSCSVTNANAGIVDGVLVMTRVSTFAPGPCLLIATAPSPFKVVVRGVPSGRYTVALRERFQTQVGGSEFQERELARRDVMLR